MPMIKYIDPTNPHAIVGASDQAVVTFPSGSVVYGPKAPRPKRLRKNETISEGELHEDDRLSRPRKAIVTNDAPVPAPAKKAPAKKAPAKKAPARRKTAK